MKTNKAQRMLLSVLLAVSMALSGWPLAAAPQSVRADGPDITTGLVAYYAMEGVDAFGKLVDSSPTANHATVYGEPSWENGIVGKAILLTGSNYAIAPDNSALALTGSITMAAWVKPTSNSTQRILSKAKQNATDGYELSLSASDAPNPQKFFTRFNQFSSNDNYRLNSISQYLWNGTWQHVAMTYDGSTIKIYKDGQLDNAMAATVSINPNTLGLGIGAQPTQTSNYPFVGSLDEVRVYNRALTASEIALLAARPTDLSITKSNGLANLRPGQGTTYTITVTNPSTQTITGAVVQDSLPETLENATWTCTKSNPSAECSGSGTGSIDDTVTIPGSSTLTYTLVATVASDAAGTITNTATVAMPVGVTDPNLANNSANDTDTIVNPPSCGNDPSLVGCWQMEEGSGTALLDSTANYNDAAITGSPTWLSGHSGQALNLSGSGQYGLAPNSPSLNITNQITMAAWIKPTKNANATQYILKKATMNSKNGYELSLSSAGKVFVRFNQSVGPDSYRVNSTSNYPLNNTAWMHIAATYDGSMIRLYINGIPEGSLPASFSIDSNTLPLGIGVQSDGTTSLFQGLLDDVRIYNRALDAAEIGQLAGLNQPPDQPTLPSPADGAPGVDLSPELSVTATDPDHDPLTVTFYGQPKTSVSNTPFTLVAIPDTQTYTTSSAGETLFNTATQWIADNQASENIAFVTHLGDITENGGNDSDDSEWTIAHTALSKLEKTADPADDVPYGVAPGNHDVLGGAARFESWFGVSHFSGRSYYAGAFDDGDPDTPPSNLNNASYFSAGGRDFLALQLDCSATPSATVLDWADGQLKAHPAWRGIVVCHNLLGSGSTPDFSATGQAIYEALKDNPNLFLMLGGHLSGSGYRSDTYDGHTVYSLRVDYQGDPNFWLRLLEFDPATNRINVRTYSPDSDTSKTDADNQFSLVYDLGAVNFQPIGDPVSIVSGGTASVTWPGLALSTDYEWYVTVSDGTDVTTGPTWSFTTRDAQPNTPPEAVDDHFFIDEDQDLVLPMSDSGSPAANDVEADPGDSLVVTEVTNPVGGAVTLNGSLQQIVFTPTVNLCGASAGSFDYTVSDGRATDTATVLVTINCVNDTPSFTKGLDQIVNEDSPAQTVPGWATAISPGPADEAGQTVNFIVSTDQSALFSTPPAVKPDGELSYTLAENACGEATVSIWLHDNGGGAATSDPQSFNITITCVNDPPSFTVGETPDQSVPEDSGSQTVSGWAQNISAGPANESPQALTFLVDNDQNSLFSAQPELNGTGTLTYTPAPNACGQATVSVQLKDDGGGSDTSPTRNFTIEVTCVNDAPVGVEDHYDTGLNAELVVGPAAGVLANDTDVESATLTAALIPGSGPAHGSLSLNADGSFTYTPATDYTGSDSFDYTASDGQDSSEETTVTITVNDTNRAPTCSDRSIATDEDVPGQVDPQCEDLDGDTLTYVAGIPAHGQAKVENGMLIYTPELDYNGGDSFTYTATDGLKTSFAATVTVTVNPVNDAPVLDSIEAQSGSEGSLIAFTAHATDADADVLTYSLASGAPTGASIDEDTGVFTWTPGEDQGPGAPSITVGVSDGLVEDTETLTITVSEVNQDPVISPIGDQTNQEGDDDISLQVTATDADIPANTLSYAASGLPGGLSINASTGLISGTLAAGSASVEPYPVTLTVTDGQTGEATASFSWTVTEPPGPLTCTAIQPTPATTGTGEKPQSKVWQHGGDWWAVFPTDSTGAASAGAWLWKLQGTTWTEVLKVSDSTTVKADTVALGDVTHVLLYAGTSTQLVSLEYTGGTYQLWSTRTTPVSIALPGSETATIAVDTTGRMWLATENDSSGSIVVYYADSPYTSWLGPVTLATGVNADDISDIIAIPGGKVGVLWSNQNAKRFGFRIHADGTDPATWAADEIPAAASAHDSIGAGMADDHLSLTAASNGTLYAAVKTGYDTAGYPKVALLVRRPAGAWDGLYAVDEAGTRGIVLLDEIHATLTVVYTSSEGYNTMVYRQSPTGTIAFGPRHSLPAGAFNDASSTRQVIDGEFAAIYAGSAQVGGVFCTDDTPPASDVDLAITKTNGLDRVRPGQPVTYTLRVENLGAQLITGAEVTDTLPASLTGATWVCAASTGSSCQASGAGSIADQATLPAGGVVTYTLEATVSLEATSSVINTASVAAPEEMTDTNPGNNSATDTDPVVVPPGCGSLPGLAGCWQMEEGSGAVILDSSGAANDGITLGGPAWVAGHSGQALHFNGTSQYGSVPDSASLDITGSITLSAWIKPERFATQDVVKKALMNGGENGSGYEITLASDTPSSPSPRKVFTRFNQGKTGDTYRVASTSDYPTDGNTWMHIAATYDSASDVIRLYINGIEEGSMPVPADFSIISNELPLTIGGQSDGARTFQGAIDDVRVFTRALSLDEICDLYGNHPPSAAGDSYAVAEDGLLEVDAAGGVLTNDGDPEGNPLTAVIAGAPSHGTLVLNADGSFTYDPAADYNGPDSFSYTAGDGRFTSPAATVALTVTPVNDPPNFVMGPGQSVSEDAGAQSVAGWATAISSGPPDENGQTLVFEVMNNTNPGLFSALPAVSDEGVLSYTPAANACGSAGVTLKLTDSEGASYTPANPTFTIQVSCVNDAPVTVADHHMIPEDIALEIPLSGEGSPLENDSDLDPGDILAITGVDHPVGGTVAINGSLQKIIFTPDSDRCEPALAGFEYTLSDGTTTATGSVAITITCVNDPPSFTKGEDQTVAEDSGARTIVNWAASISPGPVNESTQAVDFMVSNDQNGLFSAQPAVSAAGTLTFTPAANACGTANVSVRLHDNGGGTDTSAPQTFTLTITCVNDPPSFIKGEDQAVNEDSGAQTIVNWATSISAGPANESGQALEFTVDVDQSSLFSAQPSVSPGGTLAYTPADNACGAATVSVRLQDDGGGTDTSPTQTFTLAVTCVDDPPSFVMGSDQIVLEDSGAQTVSGWATGMSTGPANESSQTLAFTVTHVTDPGLFSALPAVSDEGVLSYTPATDACGEAEVSLRLDDSGGASYTPADPTFAIQVTCVNDPPSFIKGGDQAVNEDSGTQTIQNWATSISPGANNETGQTLTFEADADHPELFASQPSVDAEGTLMFAPAADACGEASVSLQLRDDGGGLDASNAQTFTITVTCVNDPPSFTKGEDQTVAEDSGAQTVEGWAYEISAGPADEWTQGLSFDTLTDDDTLFSSLPEISQVGTLTYTPAANACGLATVSVRLADTGGGSDTSAVQTFTIHITCANDSPTAVADHYTTPEDALIEIPVSGEGSPLANDQDPDGGDVLSMLDIRDPAGGTLSFDSSTRMILFTPQPDLCGENMGRFGYTLSDGEASVIGTVTITITCVNDAPVAVGESYEVDQDATLEIGPEAGLLANDSDVDSDALVVQLVNGPAHGDLSLAEDGGFRYTPVEGYFGPDRFTYQTSDGMDESEPVTVTLTVNAVSPTVPGVDKHPIYLPVIHTGL